MMTKKAPVNLTVQTIYIFIPILSLFALYRVEKLRLGILISILFSIVSWGIDYGFGVDDGADLELVYFGEHLDYLIIQIAYLVILFTVFVYLIRKWSREWNKKLPHDTF